MAVFFHIHEEAVQAFALPGGALYDEVNDVRRHALIDMKEFAAAHRRSGRLYGGIQSTLPKPKGPYLTASRVSSSASHTIYVEEGTIGPIFPKESPFLLLPGGIDMYNNRGAKGSGSVAFALGDAVERYESVSGQDAQHFMKKALNRAMMRQGYLGFTAGNPA